MPIIYNQNRISKKIDGLNASLDEKPHIDINYKAHKRNINAKGMIGFATKIGPDSALCRCGQ